MGSEQSAVQDAETLSSGIPGFDEITGGGLPRNRVTVVFGGAGCGKTNFALQRLAAGARAGAHGLFLAFEETPAQVVADAQRFEWGSSAGAEQNLGFLDAQLSPDVLRDPERSLRDAVIVTPTLMRVAPAPERRMVGNLRDEGALRAVLGEDGSRGE